MSAAIDMTGRVIGRLTVIEKAGRYRTRFTWRCACECGGEAVATGDNLRRGHTQSCGCLCRDRTSEANRTHGETHRTAEWSSYQAMINRCECPSHKQYADYGGRGIKICARWRQSYAAFLADMGRKPTPKHTLDRIENDGDYEPTNCRWATRSEQNANTRASKRKAA